MIHNRMQGHKESQIKFCQNVNCERCEVLLRRKSVLSPVAIKQISANILNLIRFCPKETTHQVDLWILLRHCEDEEIKQNGNDSRCIVMNSLESVHRVDS